MADKQQTTTDGAQGGLTMLEAITEAKRCLNCKVPQCQRACPIANEIPRWIHELSMGNLGNAMAIINTRSNLPAVCGRVCAHERQCQGSCVLGKKGRPVSIGALEQFIADFDSSMSLTHEPIVEKTRGRVAVIGSGPAGLTIAGELARRGFAVEIFEMEHEAGGVLMFGIPEYRLPKSVVKHEIEKIEHLGVTIHCDTTVGRDLTVDDLFARNFDAVFIGTGTSKPRKLDIPGGRLDGVRQAIYLLKRSTMHNEGYMRRDEVPVAEGDRVYVVGGGNTAMDAARTALRLGAAEVTVAYHRTADRMSALKAEQDEACAEGVKFMFETSIVECHDHDGVLDEIVVRTPDGDKTLPADRIILAVGSQPASRIVSTTDGIDTDSHGYVTIRQEEAPYGMTSRPGVFAAGDVTANHPATVVHAMSEARKVADGIAQYVDAVRLLATIQDR